MLVVYNRIMRDDQTPTPRALKETIPMTLRCTGDTLAAALIADLHNDIQHDPNGFLHTLNDLGIQYFADIMLGENDTDLMLMLFSGDNDTDARSAAWILLTQHLPELAGYAHALALFSSNPTVNLTKEN
jgi:hypothetical protein